MRHEENGFFIRTLVWWFSHNCSLVVLRGAMANRYGFLKFDFDLRMLCTKVTHSSITWRANRIERKQWVNREKPKKNKTVKNAHSHEYVADQCRATTQFFSCVHHANGVYIYYDAWFSIMLFCFPPLLPHLIRCMCKCNQTYRKQKLEHITNSITSVTTGPVW